ncbi:MAG TPA: hypothetical protein VMB71_01875, partial [Acetobacteraceae bacterium]|nr:hypothetical protein [Acetobacteraceae bacterium]
MFVRSCLIACLLATTAHARPLTAQDLLTLPRVSDPHLSPDATQIVYDVRTTDLAANKGVHAIYLTRLD